MHNDAPKVSAYVPTVQGPHFVTYIEGEFEGEFIVVVSVFSKITIRPPMHVGDVLGRYEGTPVGCPVGLTDGSAVGAIVGGCVGEDDGRDDGKLDGCNCLYPII